MCGFYEVLQSPVFVQCLGKIRFDALGLGPLFGKVGLDVQNVVFQILDLLLSHDQFPGLDQLDYFAFDLSIVGFPFL